MITAHNRTVRRFPVGPFPPPRIMLLFTVHLRNIRLRAVFATVAIGVSLLIGCKSTGSQTPLLAPAPGPQFSQNMPQTAPPPLILGSSEKSETAPTPLPASAQAFRPIIPEQYTVQRPVATTTVQQLPTSGVKTMPAAESLQPKIDALATKVADLEKKLAEKEELYRRSLLPGAASPSPTTVLPSTVSNPPPPVLPSIGVPGVSSMVEGDKVRISVPDTLLFQSGTLQLGPDAESALRKVVAEIRAKYPNASLSIEGHTDAVQGDPINIVQKHDLAAAKAMVVVQYFVKELLWKPDRIATTSFGAARSIADNESVEGRARNNRIDIVVSP